MSIKLFLKIFIISLLVICQSENLRAQERLSNNEFQVKGFHLDLRIQVMTTAALKNFAKELSDFGINTLIVEWEATYPYEKHATISNDLSYSRKEIKAFINYCDKLGITVIPLQQSFGHVEYILRNSRYSHLKEERKDISQICPLESEGNLALFTDLFTDMATLHKADYIHIGGDETYLLGHCEKCSLKAEKEGKSKLFVDHIKMITHIVTGLGKKPVMWADILLRHPEAAEELPKETIFIDWNYGWKTNYFGDIGALQEKGFTFWGAPAIRSHPDNWYLTDWEKHFNNQRDFIPYARKAAYEGLIMTSWSTSGLYGFTWDDGYDLVDMEQIRNVYPLSGFRILVAAYAQALKQSEPIVPEAFVSEYAQERFGLSVEESKKLWEALTLDPEMIRNSKPAKSKTIAEMISKTEYARSILYALKPKKNIDEFEHFRLMVDLRKHYLKFKALEAVYNSDNFSRKEAGKLIPKLEELIAESEMLDKRFSTSHQGFLYDKELADQNMIRKKPLTMLYDRLLQVAK